MRGVWLFVLNAKNKDQRYASFLEGCLKHVPQRLKKFPSPLYKYTKAFTDTDEYTGINQAAAMSNLDNAGMHHTSVS